MVVERSARDRLSSFASTAALGGVASAPSVPHPHSTSQQEVRHMAVQAHAPASEGLRPQGPALNESPPRDFSVAPPAPPAVDGPVVELIGHPTTAPRIASRTAIDAAVDQAVLPHQLHEIDQIIELAQLGELLVEKDARVALLERGLADWRERARLEIDARAAAERVAFERERDLIGVIHQQISAIESAEESTREAFAQADELRARLRSEGRRGGKAR